jgi:hypothetical protein
MKAQSLSLLRLVAAVAFAGSAVGSVTAQGQPELWIQDDGSDNGSQPNTLSSCLYCSTDIWVLPTADPNYDPTPFTCGTPTWTPQSHQNPQYRDPKFSTPNYMYVRVHNLGTVASLGTETLHVYWAKASTGLDWPNHWNDHVENRCGSDRLYGYEVTKPRKNGATASPQEKMDYVAAVQALKTKFFSDGRDYFQKQDDLHASVFISPPCPPAHGNLRFFPWHRELMNRYEVLLRESHPTLTLLYWDWNTFPQAGAAPTILGPQITPGYMGTWGTENSAFPFAQWGITRLTRTGAPTVSPWNFTASLNSCSFEPKAA